MTPKLRGNRMRTVKSCILGASPSVPVESGQCTRVCIYMFGNIKERCRCARAGAAGLPVVHNPQSSQTGAHSLPSLPSPSPTLGAAAGHVRGLVPYCGPIYTLSSGFVVRSGPTGTGRDFQNGNRRGAGGDRRVAGEKVVVLVGWQHPGTGAAHGARSLQSVLSVSLSL